MSFRALRLLGTSGNMRLYRTAALHKDIAMTAASTRRIALLSALAVALGATAFTHAETSPSATAAWTVKVNGDIRWQQVTPAGALLVSTDSELAAIDTDRGRIAWEKAELGGLAIDSVKPVEGSLLMEATRQGLLLIFDPVTGAVVFDSRKLDLTQVITRRVLPQSGTLLVHGQRGAGAPIVALYDLASGQQLWTNESLFTESEAPKR